MYKVLCIKSTFNSDIVDRLHDGVNESLENSEVEIMQLEPIYVPGAFELPYMAKKVLDNEDYIRLSLYNATKISNSKLINLTVYKFKPQGITGLAMLADSHISMHTWPEKNIAKCDIFTCNDKCLPELAVQYIGERFKAKQVTSETFDRLL